MFIDKGQLIQSVNVTDYADVQSRYANCAIEVNMVFQLFHQDGTPARGSYKGPGTIVDHGDCRHAILGDPYRSTNLEEFIISPKATPESETGFSTAVSAVHAALGGNKPGRRMTSKGTYEWLRTYDEAMAERKRIDALG